MTLTTRGGFLFAILVALSMPARAQSSDGPFVVDMSIPAGGPFSRDAVLNAPFSADATTNVAMRLPDGSARDYTVTSRYYRDSQGRVRAEMDTPAGAFIVLEIPSDPSTRDHPPFYILDPVERTYTIGPGNNRLVATLFNGEARAVLPLERTDRITTRFCLQVAPPLMANTSEVERLEAVNAEVSPDLGIVLASHRADAIGSVDYRVTNIRRGEPSADLFDALTTYTFKNKPVLAIGPWQSPPVCKPVKK
jgi:hypothetical protein